MTMVQMFDAGLTVGGEWLADWLIYVCITSEIVIRD